MATARDIVLVMVLVFSFAVAAFLIHFTVATLSDNLMNTSVINESTDAISMLEQGKDKALDRLDYFIFIVFMGLIISIIIMGWFVGGHPIFMFLYFIVLLVTVVLSTVLSNIWVEITGLAVFGSTLIEFGIMNNIISNLPIVMSVVGFLGMIVMFAKPYFQQSEI